MNTDLKTFIRVRDWRVDEKRRVVGRLLRDLDDLKAEARGFAQEVTAEQEIARSAPAEAGMAYAGYAQRILDRRAELDRAIANAEAAVSAAKDDLARAYRDLKTVELVQENRARREAAEAERRQTIALDEIALQGFRQRRVDP
jgi:flagellar export protein FliJ